MILIDTSVWIEFFRNKNSSFALKLQGLLEKEEELCLLDLIVTEILQGITEDHLFEEIKKYLLDFPIFRAKDLNTYIHAAQIYRLCRKKGKTIRHTVDLLIASIALENGLEIFHHDRDFDSIAQYTNLKIFKL